MNEIQKKTAPVTDLERYRTTKNKVTYKDVANLATDGKSLITSTYNVIGYYFDHASTDQDGIQPLIEIFNWANTLLSPKRKMPGENKTAIAVEIIKEHYNLTFNEIKHVLKSGLNGHYNTKMYGDLDYTTLGAWLKEYKEGYREELVKNKKYYQFQKNYEYITEGTPEYRRFLEKIFELDRITSMKKPKYRTPTEEEVNTFSKRRTSSLSGFTTKELNDMLDKAHKSGSAQMIDMVSGELKRRG